ncbi:MAG: aminopeptidase P family protein [Clostridia bacterium]|nr:aminopeptidase P family protein [Clostridia bacterium]
MIEKRIENIRKALADNSAGLITNESDCFYFSGFNRSEGMVLVTPDTATLFVDFRYIEAAKKASKIDVRLTDNFFRDIYSLLKNESITTVFVQSESVTLSKKKLLDEAFDGIHVSTDINLDKIIREMRAVKSAEEIALIKSAQDITDRAFSYILTKINAGKTEREIALELELFMKKEGSEGVAFDTICVSGENSSKPHGIPGNKIIEDGDFLTLDFGAIVGGYRSDMTRTVCVGKPTDKMTYVYNTVLKAQTEAIASVKSGVACKCVDKVARDIIETAGFKGCFGHGLGHSVGIDIHESPYFNTRCEALTKPGMVITVEPGIYLQNEFGVRIEDMIVVTENGCEDITKSNKSLVII